MKRHVAVMFCVMGLLGAACAGSLEDPSRFEQGIKNAEGDDDGEVDAGTPPADDQGDDDDGTADDGTADDGAADDGAADDDAPAAGCDEAPALLETKCGNASCHGDLQTAASLDLISEDPSGLAGADAQCTSDFKLIAPGSPETSLLYLKLTDDFKCGSKMPLGGSLTADELECVSNWIKGL